MFSFSAPGDYVIQRDRANIYYTFTPGSLSHPKVNIKTDEELTMLLSKAHRLLGILEGIERFNENIDVIESLSIKRESLRSYQSEGSQAFEKDILYPDKKRAKVTLELSRYIEAIEYGKEKLNEGYSNRLLCDLYRIICGVEPCNNDNYFREKQLFDIPGVFINIESYNPTAPEDIMPVMTELEKYMCSKQPVDELIKIGLFIYQFITISPFNTDNKKLGRVLLSLLLIESGVLSRHLVCYSDFVLQDPIGFYNRLASVRIAGDYKEWIKYYLKGIIFSAENAITRINKITLLRDEHLKKIYSVDESKDNLLKLLGYIEKVPMFNIKMASKGIDLSFNTTAKAVNILKSLDIIEQENELIRNRCYVYRKYKDIAFG
jgi:Fic family protein